MAGHMIAAFLIALLSGLGVGGGGLFAVYLSVFSDLPQLAAQGANLLFFLFSSGASVTVNLFRRHIIFPAVALMIVTGIAGAAAGSLLAHVLPDLWLRKIFGMMLIAGGIMAIKRKN